MGSEAQQPPHESSLDDSPHGDDLFCPECLYNLRGVESDRCPECGTAFDPATLQVSRIPWVHRREIGWLRAYWRTVVLAIFRNQQLSNEKVRPVAYADSQSFRWMTVAHVMLAVLIGAFALMTHLVTTQSFVSGELVYDVLMFLVAVFAIKWFLAAATGAPSYFFHPKKLPVEYQNRLIAMSYYTTAPLAWAPVTAVLLITGVILYDDGNGNALLLTLAVILAVLQPALWWLGLVSLAVRGMQLGPSRNLLVAFGVPALWLVVAAVTLIGIPLVIGYVTLVVASLS